MGRAIDLSEENVAIFKFKSQLDQLTNLFYFKDRETKKKVSLFF